MPDAPTRQFQSQAKEETMSPTIQLSNVLESARSVEVEEPLYWRPEQPGGEPEVPVPVRAFPVEGLISAPATNEELHLVQKLFFLGGNRVPRVAVFCGIRDADGAKLVCARTAEVLAGLVTEPVCLMDANFKVPTSHLQFDLDATSPLAVQEPENYRAVTPISGPNLWIVPAPRVKDGRPILSPDGVRNAVTELRKKFGFLLISAPPLGKGTEALFLSQVADGLVLAILARSTERKAVRKVRADLETYKIRLLGAVLNQQLPQEKSWKTGQESEMN
jgi:Mrp family chromosome partitioning ATPase